MNQRILVLDDEPHLLRLLERIMIEKTPYAIETVDNSLEVPSLLEDNRYDLIITDLKMPGIDGLDILRLVKAKELDTEVIIITAFGALETAIQALSAGAFDYIVKPFKKEQIIFSVNRALQCQAVKRIAAKAVELFELRPYRRAETAFCGEYIRTLAGKLGNDAAVVAGQSGLPMETIERILNDKQ